VYRAPLTALTLSTLSPFILLGDLMKSVTLLRLDTAGGKVELATVARDYAPLWMTSVAVVEEGWFLGAEDSGNIVGWKRNDDLNPDESRLTMSHEMRFGEMINRIRIGIFPLLPSRLVWESRGVVLGLELMWCRCVECIGG